MATATSLPVQLDLPAIYQGASYRRVLTWSTGGIPVDLSGYTAAMKVKAGTTTVIELTTENDRITLGGDEGTIQLDITADDTADLTPCNGEYDLLLTDGDGFVTALVVGNIAVRKGVTAT